jgi:phosphopantetheinyl transferase
MPGNLKVETDASQSAATDLVVWLAIPDAARSFRVDALGSAEQLRYARIRRDMRRRDFEVSRALLQGLGEAAYTPSRLSHSGGYACTVQIKAGASSDLALGIDLEAHRPRDELSLARFAFSEAEVEGVEALPAAERGRRFYALWTMKEAMAKAFGLALPDALRECVFVQHAGEWRARVPTDAACSLAVFEPRPALTLAVALVGPPGPVRVRMHEWPSGAQLRWPAVVQVSRGRRGDPDPRGNVGEPAPVLRA